ncbi:MAG: glycerol-3-phosphate 1-O-acyltransferase PlsY [Alphaproteobacteria bacterium]|nr:glycerol-3-phosphate 1-O-acyltransferase PlsY [Alphaproteobacteria bacterium]
MPDPIAWSYVWPYLLAALAFGYLAGSIPFGLLLTRAAGLGDIRKVGSGNIGATNVLRAGGKKLAAAALLLDAGKGLVPVLIAAQAGPHPALAAALGAVLGHLFPVWLGFKGGKGMATALGVLWGLAWAVGAIACLGWLVVALVFRMSSLASLMSIAIGAAAAWILASTQPFGLVLSNTHIAELATILVPLVWVKHAQNIRRLIAGTEPRIGAKA